MSDFMREVDEDYRRERTMRALSRFQIPIALAVIAIVAGAGIWRFSMDRRVAAAEADNARFAAAETLARDGDTSAAQKSFATLAADGVAGYPLLSRMRASEMLAAADPEAAAKAFDAIASEEGGSQALHDAARFRGALLRVDREEPKKFEDQYGRFARADFTFHAGMRELLALAAMKRGDDAAAQRYLGEIVIDGEAPAPLRGRAQAFLELARSGAASPTDKPAPPATITQAATPAPAASAGPAAGPSPAAAPAPTASPSPPAAPAPSDPAAAPPSAPAPADPPPY